MEKNQFWLSFPQIKGKVPELHVIMEVQGKMHIVVVEGKDIPAVGLLGKCNPFVELILAKKS